MPTVFTEVIEGRLPGRIVHTDAVAAAFLTIAPIRPGHTLVVPRLEVDDWLDVPADVSAHCFALAATVGRALRAAFRPTRVAMIIAGLEVPHCHLHLIPIESESDLSFAKADHRPDPAAMDAAADRIRQALAAL